MRLLDCVVFAALVAAVFVLGALATEVGAEATSSTNVHFTNITAGVNDLHINLNSACTAVKYTGGPGGANFPVVTGVGTSSINMSGTTVTNPGYSMYCLTIAGNSGFDHIQSADWTTDGLRVADAAPSTAPPLSGTCP